MEIYFDKEIVFPYAFLAGIQQRYDKYNDCNIYMLMLADKLEILSVRCQKECIRIKYKNLVTKEKNILKLAYRRLWNLQIPRRFIKLQIENFGTILDITLNEQGKRFLVQMYPHIMCENVNIKINVYDLLNVCMTENDIQEKMTVLYIGQSSPQKEYKTIFDRLRKHEKILEVFRRYNLEYRDKELMVFLGHVKSKLHNMGGMLILSSSMWEKYDSVGEIIDESSIIDISEAMLIYHYKPKYNIKLKDSIPNINMKTYNQFIKAGVDRIDLGLDLYFEDCEIQINLETDTQQVFSKMRILHCLTEELYQKQIDAHIYYEDVDDELYKLISL